MKYSIQTPFSISFKDSQMVTCFNPLRNIFLSYQKSSYQKDNICIIMQNMYMSDDEMIPAADLVFIFIQKLTQKQKAFGFRLRIFDEDSISL